jgi:hypothetical protein
MPRLSHAIAVALALLLPACDEITTPTTPSATSPVTETFFSIIGVKGVATRSLTVATTGTVTLTLTRSGPPDNVPIGLGIGIPQANGSGCSLSQSADVSPGAIAQVSVSVEAGNYCVRVYDAGYLAGDTQFSVTIVRP